MLDNSIVRQLGVPQSRFEPGATDREVQMQPLCYAASPSQLNLQLLLSTSATLKEF